MLNLRDGGRGWQWASWLAVGGAGRSHQWEELTVGGAGNGRVMYVITAPSYLHGCLYVMDWLLCLYSDYGTAIVTPYGP